jgi:hypothetical protein
MAVWIPVVQQPKRQGTGRKFIGGKTYEKIDRVSDRGCHAAVYDAYGHTGGGTYDALFEA